MEHCTKHSHCHTGTHTHTPASILPHFIWTERKRLSRNQATAIKLMEIQIRAEGGAEVQENDGGEKMRERGGYRGDRIT